MNTVQASYVLNACFRWHCADALGIGAMPTLMTPRRREILDQKSPKREADLRLVQSGNSAPSRLKARHYLLRSQHLGWPIGKHFRQS